MNVQKYISLGGKKRAIPMIRNVHPTSASLNGSLRKMAELKMFTTRVKPPRGKRIKVDARLSAIANMT